MKIWIKNLLTVLAVAVLSGCKPPPPTMFGVPVSQWNTLSKSQQRQVIQGYNERQKINAQNAPINNTINAARGVIATQQMNQQMNREMSPPNWTH